MIPWFNVRKAAQVAAFFALKDNRSINVLKLVKLIYLSDRKFLDLYEIPILNDLFVSMPHGPVNSISYDYINGAAESEHWDEFLLDREKHDVGLTQPNLSTDDLDELSRAELKVLQEMWDQFGHMDRFEIKQYTHDNCPEWEDPQSSSSPIPYSRVLNFLQKANSIELEDRILSERQISSSFAE